MTKSITRNLLIAGDEKGFLYFHDLTSGELLKSTPVHGNAVSGLTFNSTWKLLISFTYDGEVKIFDFEKDKNIQSIFSPDYAGIRFVLFSIADGFIYFNGHNRLYKTRSDLSQEVKLIINENNSLNDGVITSDRSALIYAVGNRLKVMNTRSDIIVQDLVAGTANVERLALVGDSILASWSSDGTISLWNYLLGQLQYKPIFSYKGGNPSPMSFSADGKYMSSGFIGNWARIWEPYERNVFQELFLHKNTVTATSFGISDQFLYTGSLDGKIIEWKKGATLDIKKITEPEEIETSNATTQKTDTTPPVKATQPAEQPTENGPHVIINDRNIPSVINGRKVINTIDMILHSAQPEIYVFDNSNLDGDTISLYFNGHWLLDHYGVTKKKKKIELTLQPNTNNYLVLFANNLGKTPPNTAAVEIIDGNVKKIFRLSSDLKTCSAINFIFRP